MRDDLSLAAAASLTQYLAAYPWDFWFTVTAPGKFKYPAMAVSVGLSAISPYAQRAFVGAERHYLGGWHAHGIVFGGQDAGRKDGVVVAVADALRARSRGYCKVERTNNNEAVCAYLSKYITKDLDAEWQLTGFPYSWTIDKRLPGA